MKRRAMQRVLVLLLKVAVTTLLIYLSVRTVSLETLSARFASLHWGWISLMLGVLAGNARGRKFYEAFGMNPYAIEMMKELG